MGSWSRVTRHLFVGGLATALVAAGLVVPTGARADELHWHPLTQVPGLADFTGANLGADTFDVGALTANINGQAAWLSVPANNQPVPYGPPASSSVYAAGPNFDGIVLSTTAAGQALHYLRGKGGFGPALPVSGVQSISANQTGLVSTSVVGDTLQATDYGFGSDGAIVQQGDPATIFTGAEPPVSSWVVAGYGAVADVIVDTGSGLAEVYRGSDGGWGTAAVVAAPDGHSIDPHSVHVSGGGADRVVLAFSDADDRDLYAAVLGPEGRLGPVETLLSRVAPTAGFARLQSIFTAAGGGGTVAVAAQTLDCQSSTAADDISAGVDVWTATPQGDFVESAVPDTAWSPTGTSALTALGAGGGEALVGLQTEQVTRDTTGAFDAASCAQTGPTGEVDATFTDVADVTGAGEQSLGSGTGSLDGAGAPAGRQVAIDLVHVARDGSAGVYGYLSSALTPQFAEYSARPDVAPTALPPPLPVAPARGGGAPASAKLALLRARVTVTQETAVRRGRQTFVLDNPLAIPETVRLTEYAPGAVLTGRRATRPFAAATVKLRPHAKARVTVSLTASARARLAHQKLLPVVLRVVPSSTGRASGLLTRRLTLHPA